MLFLQWSLGGHGCEGQERRHMKRETHSGENLSKPLEKDGRPFPHHLTEAQMKRLMEAFRSWRESAGKAHTQRVRGRYWLTFILLRFTGARIGEVLKVRDDKDIDLARGEVRIAPSPTSPGKSLRTIPLPPEALEDLAHYLKAFPHMKGKVFALDQGNFRREFYQRAQEARIPRELSHPHILRHTRAMELLDAEVPLTVVRDILGHSLTSTTAVYLRRKEMTIRSILRDKGLL